MNQGQDAAGSLGKIAREKLWTERDRDEKLDALRNEVVYLLHKVEQATDLLDKLLHHAHANDGRILCEMHRSDEPQFSSRYVRQVPNSLRDREI